MVTVAPVQQAESEMMAVVKSIEKLAKAQANSVQTEAGYGEKVRKKGQRAGAGIVYDSMENNRVPAASTIPTGQDEAVSVAQLAGDITPIGEVYLPINPTAGGLDSSRFRSETPPGVIARNGLKGELVIRSKNGGWENIANYSPPKGELLVLGSVRYSDFDFATLVKYNKEAADRFFTKEGKRKARWDDEIGDYKIEREEVKDNNGNVIKDANGDNTGPELIDKELAKEFFELREGSYYTYSLEMGGIRPVLPGDFLRKYKKSKSGKFLDENGVDIILDNQGNRVFPKYKTYSDGRKEAILEPGMLTHYRVEIKDETKPIEDYEYILVNVDGSRMPLKGDAKPIILTQGIHNGTQGIDDPRTRWIDGTRKDLGFYYDNHFCKNTGRILSFKKTKLGSSVPAEHIDPSYKGSNAIDKKFWNMFEGTDSSGRYVNAPQYDIRLFITVGGNQIAYDPYSNDDKNKLINAGILKDDHGDFEKVWKDLQVAVTLHCERGGKLNKNINLSHFLHDHTHGNSDGAKITTKISTPMPDNVLTPRIRQGATKCFTDEDINPENGKRYKYLVQRKRLFNYKTPTGVAIDEFNAIYLEFDEKQQEFLPVPEYKTPELGMEAVWHDWVMGEKVFQHEMRFFQAGLQGQSDGVSVPAPAMMWHGRMIDQVTGQYMQKYLKAYANFWGDDFILNDFTDAGPMNPFLRQSKTYMQNRETAHQHFQSSRQGYFADNLETLKWEYAMARCVGDMCMSAERIGGGLKQSSIAAVIGGTTAAVMGAGFALSALPVGAIAVVTAAVAGGLVYSAKYQFSRDRKNHVSQEELDRHADTTAIYGLHDGESTLAEKSLYGKKTREMTVFNFVGLENDLYCFARGLCGMVYIRNGGLKAESNFNSKAVVSGLTAAAGAAVTTAALVGMVATPLAVTAALATVTVAAMGYSGWNFALAKMAHEGRTFALQQRKEFDYFKDYCKDVFTEESLKTKDVRARPGDKVRPSLGGGGASLG